MKSRYTAIQFKRYLIKFPPALLVTILTLALIVAGAGLAFHKSGEKAGKKIVVGVTGDIDNTYLEAGIYAVENFDSSRFSVDFVPMTIPEAKDALAGNEISGYVQFPHGFAQGIIRGENKPATYVFGKNTVNFGSVITGEICKVVSDLVVQVQGAVYSMRSIAKDEGIKKGLGKRAMKMNEMIVTKVLARDSLYDVEILGVRDNLSMGGYYLGAVIIFFLLLWGLSFSALLGTKSVQHQKLLKMSGVSEGRQVKSEILPFFAFTLFIIALFALCLFCVINPTKPGIAELEGAGCFEYIGFVIAIVPVIAMMCMMHFFIYELTGSTVSAVLFEIILALLGGYISGCFFPGYFFPDAVAKIADILPVGAGFSYIRKAISATLSLKTFALVCAYAAMFFALSVRVRKIRLAGDGR